MKTIISVVGARPNFMKIAPLERCFKAYPDVKHLSIHTGQHYDKDMSDIFFEQLGLSAPVQSLGVGSGNHGEMTGKIMVAFEKACLEINPDLVIVVGDVNSTIAAALVARKLCIPVSHVESGLRSFDETMPEELNRRLTDCLSNLLFVSEPSGMENLRKEGIDMNRAHLVGDIMLETLQTFMPLISKAKSWERFDLLPNSYCLITLHRPSNVDSKAALLETLDIIEAIPFPKLFAIHPRTVKRLEEFGLKTRVEHIQDLKLVGPQPYIEFLSLLQGSKMILSDSGSVQAESSFFNIPCLVCRENTERPFYQDHGTSILVGRNRHLVSDAVREIQNNNFKKSSEAVKQIGTHVGEKIVKITVDYLLSI